MIGEERPRQFSAGKQAEKWKDMLDAAGKIRQAPGGGSRKRNGSRLAM
jgi:hypothetical protein